MISRKKRYFVYILTTKNNQMLYIGVTNNLTRRLGEHIRKRNKGFTASYNIKKLIYYESYTSILEAIAREKQLKNWHADWKWNLVKEANPELVSLNEEVLGP